MREHTSQRITWQLEITHAPRRHSREFSHMITNSDELLMDTIKSFSSFVGSACIVSCDVSSLQNKLMSILSGENTRVAVNGKI